MLLVIPSCTGNKYMEELISKKEIKLKHLIVQREDIIKKLTNAEIDERYYRRKTLKGNHTKDEETELVNIQNKVETLKDVLGLIEEEIERELK